ncbi:hypothetical protein ACIPL1_24535 [Pseudomonas sp. NPDC090202]|uniref:hypothetical protein n=1 Tax=unclassified Pseudomonas TaxID=196821 RepID=UPI00382B71AC
MQRITRDTTSCAPELLNALESKVRLLQRYFPPSVASLYAIPRSGSENSLQWWSDLGGQPLPYSHLDATAQQALLVRYNQRQDAIGRLVEELQQRGKADDASTLRTLIGAPDLANLYSLNQEPVVIRWGLPPQETPAAPPLAPAETSPAPSRKKASRRWWLRLPFWLFLIPLLLLLLWLLWTWRGGLWHLLHPVKVGNYACTQGAPPPDFAVVLDTSGSMNLNINASADDEAWLNQIGDKLPDSNPRKARILAEPTRLTVAKQAFDAMIGQLHPDIQTRLITFRGCQGTVDHGVFAQNSRPQLITDVQQLGAEGGTPLAASLVEAASKVDGRFQDSLVVMFVDGEDGCHQNACDVSAQIARQQPRLRVNVVNISDSTLSNCIAENTGGRVYAANEVGEVQRMLREAVEEVARTPACEDAIVAE